jgi:hypothetical protein
MVYLGKNTFHKVEGHGYVGIKFFGRMIKYLQKVPHDPSLCKTLISMSQVVDSRHKLEFTTHICLLMTRMELRLAQPKEMATYID